MIAEKHLGSARPLSADEVVLLRQAREPAITLTVLQAMAAVHDRELPGECGHVVAQSLVVL